MGAASSSPVEITPDAKAAGTMDTLGSSNNYFPSWTLHHRRASLTTGSPMGSQNMKPFPTGSVINHTTRAPDVSALLQQLGIDWNAFDVDFNAISVTLVDKLLHCSVDDGTSEAISSQETTHTEGKTRKSSLNYLSSLQGTLEETTTSSLPVLVPRPPLNPEPHTPSMVLMGNNSHPFPPYNPNSSDQLYTSLISGVGNDWVATSTQSLPFVPSSNRLTLSPLMPHFNSVSGPLLQPHPPQSPMKTNASALPPTSNPFTVSQIRITPDLRLAILEMGFLGVRKLLDAVAFCATGECRADWTRGNRSSFTYPSTSNLSTHLNNGTGSGVPVMGPLRGRSLHPPLFGSDESVTKGAPTWGVKPGFSETILTDAGATVGGGGGAQQLQSASCTSVSVSPQNSPLPSKSGTWHPNAAAQHHDNTLTRMRHQQCAMQLAPSTFGEESYNNTLLINMNARSTILGTCSGINASFLGELHPAPHTSQHSLSAGTSYSSVQHLHSLSNATGNVGALPFPSQEAQLLAESKTTSSSMFKVMSSFSIVESAGAHHAPLTHGPTDDRGASLRGLRREQAIDMVCHMLVHLHLTTRDLFDFLQLLLESIRDVHTSSFSEGFFAEASGSVVTGALAQLLDVFFTPQIQLTTRVLRHVCKAAGAAELSSALATHVAATPPSPQSLPHLPRPVGQKPVKLTAFEAKSGRPPHTPEALHPSQVHAYFRDGVGSMDQLPAPGQPPSPHEPPHRWCQDFLVQNTCAVLHYAQLLPPSKNRTAKPLSGAAAVETFTPRPPPSSRPKEPKASLGTMASGEGRQPPLLSVPSVSSAGGATNLDEQHQLVWPLRTRLLSLRCHYLCLFDALASSLAVMGGSKVANLNGNALRARVPATLSQELGTPIVLLDTSGAAGNDFCVVRGNSAAETLHVPSARRYPAEHPTFNSNPTPQSAYVSKGSSLMDVDVYRVQQTTTGYVMLLTLPAANDPAPDLVPHDLLGTSMASLTADQLTSTSGPAPPSLTPSHPIVPETNNSNGSQGGDAGQEFSVLSSQESVKILVYPLRVLYRGLLHHFLFQNAGQRAQWVDQLSALTALHQSKKHQQRAACAAQCTASFIRNRMSYPVGPSAFEYVDMLGAGAFGRVLLVRHILTGKKFAMKIVRKTVFHGIRNVIEARRELSIMASLDCAYILKIHATFQTDSRFYLLLDYLPGGELLLHTQRAKGHRFEEHAARFCIAELAIAVEHLRLKGVVHRDIKGDNLVLDGEGHVVLTDFGFAKKITTDESLYPAVGDNPPGRIMVQRTSCGTRAYIAPEVIDLRSEGYGLEVDWWSTGVVLFTLLTGFFPFLKQTEHETNKAITHAPLQLPAHLSLSDAAKSLLLGLLHKNPAKRLCKLSHLKQHPFFHDFDWEACEKRQLPPPTQLHPDAYYKPLSPAVAAQTLRESMQVAREEQLNRRLSLSLIPTQRVSKSSVKGSDGSAKDTRYAAELAEEREELQRVEAAFGSDRMPYPTRLENDLFGSLYLHQEILGSMRDVVGGAIGDVDAENDYIPAMGIHLCSSLAGDLPCRQRSLSASLSTAGVGEAYSEHGERLLPVLEDYNELAYTSLVNIQPEDTYIGSSTSLCRPLMGSGR